MGWFDKIFRRGPKKWKWAQTIDGYSPLFTQYGTDIYAFDVVQQALKCIVDEMKKLNPTHIRVVDNDPVPVKSSIQDVLSNPNPLMTTSDFIEKTTWLLLLNYNVFILPTYYTWIDEKTKQEKRKYESLYPLKPDQVNFIEDMSGRLFVQMYFRNGFETTVAYEDLIHIRYNYSVNEYMGGDIMGQPDNRALLQTLNLNQSLLQGVSKAMNASYAINGIVKYNTLIDDGKTEAALKELEQKLRNSESGFLPLDLKAEFTPIQHDMKLVDKDTLEFVDTKILRTWGVPLKILTGDYEKRTYEAFYQKTLEPLIISFGQAFSKKLFTDREKSFGNEIKFYPKELIFMTMQEKLEMVKLLSNSGALYENEKRTAFGFRPLPELAGKRYMSLNWVDVNNSTEYQLGRDRQKEKDKIGDISNADEEEV